MLCKYCQSGNVRKYGKYKDTQYYYCNDCERKFKDDDFLFHMKVPSDYVSSALDMYYRGLSYKDISEHLDAQHDYRPPKSVVFQWVDKYTQKAVGHFRDYNPPKLGDRWIADETVLDIDGHNVWFWDIIDYDTDFLIASTASLTRTTTDATRLMEQAYKRAGKAPKEIVTDKLKAYLDSIELTFGGDTVHVQGSPFSHRDESTAKIERFHSTLKERTKVMRGFRDIDTLLEFTDGFLVYYNFFRKNEALEDRTPAEVAGIKYDVKNWLDLTELPVSK
jgi:transposase-like protein